MKLFSQSTACALIAVANVTAAATFNYQIPQETNWMVSSNLPISTGPVAQNPTLLTIDPDAQHAQLPTKVRMSNQML